MHPTFKCLAVAALLLASVHAASATNSFNPKISLILQGNYASYSSTADADIPGFILGPETELRPEGLSLGESELAIEANIDHRFHGWATVAFEQEEGETVVAIEEAYIDTLSLPAGLSLKFGRFFSDIGYQNRQHSHAWDFADAPLVYRAMLGGRLADDGLQLRWVAPTDLFIEAGAELLRGDGFPAGVAEGSSVGSWTAFVHAGGDWGTGGSWRAGLSHLRATAQERVSGEDAPIAYSGDSGLSIIDWVYKWAPGGNTRDRNLILQGEYFWRSEDGTLTDDPEGAATSSSYSGDQSGYYLQAVYQFTRGWRSGLRWEQLEAENRLANPVPGTSLDAVADDAGVPERLSLMLDYSPSEFSRFRLQFNRDRSRPGSIRDEQLLLQYIFSLGAHPAHQF